MEAVNEGTEPTQRELQVLLAFAQTGSTKDAGDRLGLVPQTVRNHLHAIHQRLGVQTSVEAIWRLRAKLEAIEEATA